MKIQELLHSFYIFEVIIINLNDIFIFQSLLGLKLLKYKVLPTHIKSNFRNLYTFIILKYLINI